MDNKNSRDIDPFSTLEEERPEDNEKNNKESDNNRRINSNRNGHIFTSRSNTTSTDRDGNST